MIDGYVAGYDAWNECHPDNPEYQDKNKVMVQIKKANPDCPLCHGSGMIVKDEFQKSAPRCHLCFPNEQQEAKREKTAPSTPISHTQGGDGFLEWLDEDIKYRQEMHKLFGGDGQVTISDIGNRIILEDRLQVRAKYLSREQVGDERWTSVKESLPEKETKVWMSMGNDVCEAFIDKEGEWCGYQPYGWRFVFDAEYWKPFKTPAPPAPTDKALVGEGVPRPWTNKVYQILKQRLEAFGDTDNGIRIFGRIEAAHDIVSLFSQELSSLRSQLSKMTAEKAAIKTAFEEQYIELQKLKNK